MKKRRSVLVTAVFILSISLVVAAMPVFTTVYMSNSNGHARVSIPERAVEVTPGIFRIGPVIRDGESIEGYMILEYREGYAKPSWAGGNKNGGKTTCYESFSKGAKWKITEPYILNTNNQANLNPFQIRNTISEAITEWESEAENLNIFGNEINGTVDFANIGSLNGKNEIGFADINEAGVIGVTFIWGRFNGAPGNRELVEWDQIYDDTDFSWSHTGAAGSMDFENIVQHEMGHSFGLTHPDSTCTEETMFAFASNGETKKRTLNAGDIEGILSLY